MPRIAELKQIDGAVWARIEINEAGGEVTLWSQSEIHQFRQDCVRDFLIDQFDQWKARQ